MILQDLKVNNVYGLLRKRDNIPPPSQIDLPECFYCKAFNVPVN